MCASSSGKQRRRQKKEGPHRVLAFFLPVLLSLFFFSSLSLTYPLVFSLCVYLCVYVHRCVHVRLCLHVCLSVDRSLPLGRPPFLFFLIGYFLISFPFLSLSFALALCSLNTFFLRLALRFFSPVCPSLSCPSPHCLGFVGGF